MDELESTLERLLVLLARSEDSAWSSQSVEQLDAIVRLQLESLRQNGSIDGDELRFAVLPTGSLQETSIDNGWGDEFLKLAAIIENHTQP